MIIISVKKEIKRKQTPTGRMLKHRTIIIMIKI